MVVDERQMWAGWGGTKPLGRPVCGWNGDLCEGSKIAFWRSPLLLIHATTTACQKAAELMREMVEQLSVLVHGRIRIDYDKSRRKL